MLPVRVAITSGYVPGFSEGLISTSTKRYVPRSLTDTFDTRISGFVELTDALRRFVPPTSSLTGLIECFAHHDGGSTFVTVGVDWAQTVETEHRKTNSKNSSLRFFGKFLFVSRKGAKKSGRNQFPGVRGFVLSPEALVGNGGKLSPSFAGVAIGVAPCWLTSSNRLNSANSLSASSFFLSRE